MEDISIQNHLWVKTEVVVDRVTQETEQSWKQKTMGQYSLSLILWAGGDMNGKKEKGNDNKKWIKKRNKTQAYLRLRQREIEREREIEKKHNNKRKTQNQVEIKKGNKKKNEKLADQIQNPYTAWRWSLHF